MRKRIMLTSLLAVVLVLVAAPTVLAAYAGNAANPTSGTTGTAVAWTADGFTPGETVTFRFCSLQTVVGTDVADASGNAHVAFNVPATASVGACTITATGETSGRVVTTGFTVTGGLAYTGAQIMFWVMAGLGLIALGAGLLMKRRTVRA
ncbi:MAG: hypothetical protein ABH838_01910 [Actinomycetota bacterium]